MTVLVAVLAAVGATALVLLTGSLSSATTGSGSAAGPSGSSAGSSTAPVPSASSAAGTSNPARTTVAVRGSDLADPFVLTVGTTMYAYGTNADGAHIPVLITTAPDLRTWTREGDAPPGCPVGPVTPA